MKSSILSSIGSIGLVLLGLGVPASPLAQAGTLHGRVLDPNWYAKPYSSNVFGMGCYEYAVNANGTNVSSLGGFDDTDTFGAFQLNNLAGGSYTVASWDVWWRSAYAFNVPVPASGAAPLTHVRLRATMWGYPVFWDETGYYEFGQTFAASGPISMIYLRDPLGSAFTRTITVHQGGPGGVRVGVSRTYGNGGDQRLIYGYAEMPTQKDQIYYLRVRTSSIANPGVLRQMDPRPDYSDPMPEGCLWLGTGGAPVAQPDRDLGVVIMSDDDGLVTDLFARASGPAIASATTVGQSFIARGVNLISAAFWLADPGLPTYVVRLLQGGPGGAQVGTEKRGRPARPNADPEMIVCWAPGECPLTPGETYYLEVRKDGGGVFYSTYANQYDPFAYGSAYRDGSPLAGTDLAGTIMEEEGAGAATRPAVQLVSDPIVVETTRGSNALTISWRTDVASDSLVQYAVETPPYAMSNYVPALVTVHQVNLSNLQPHTLYHYRVSSAADSYRTAVSRDFVICTKPAASNLLANPSFEQGTGGSPRAIVGWTGTGSLDIKASDGTWFGGLPPTNGSWICEGAVNGSSSDGCIYQRVSGVSSGQEYTFSAWVYTVMRENGTTKYDVWYDSGRLIYMRLGIDPAGGTDPASSSIQWTPRLYSHKHYTQLAKTAIARATNLTVFVHMKGQGGEWHMYGIDGCALTHEEIPTRFTGPGLLPDGSFQVNVHSRANRMNSIEASTTLPAWGTLTNYLNVTGTAEFVDKQASNFTRRFFRARVGP